MSSSRKGSHSSGINALIQALPINDPSQLDASVAKLKEMGPNVAVRLCWELDRLIPPPFSDYTYEALDEDAFNIVKAICMVLPKLVQYSKDTEVFLGLPKLVDDQDALNYAFHKFDILKDAHPHNTQIFIQAAEAMIAMSPYAVNRLRAKFMKTSITKYYVGDKFEVYVLSRLKDVHILEPVIRKISPTGGFDFYIECLAAYGKDYTKTFIRFLSDKDEEVRMTAAQVLGLIGDPQSIGPLISVLRDGQRFVRVAAICAVGNYAGHFDANILLPFLDDESPLVQKYTIITMQLIDPSRLSSELDRIISDKGRKDYVREAAQEALDTFKK
jgi:hypothetical protein